MDSQSRTCSRCSKTYPFDQFPKMYKSKAEIEANPKSQYYRRNYCMDCYRKQYNGYNRRPSNRLRHMIFDSRKKASRKGWQFDLDIEFLLELFEKQSGKCGVTGYDMHLHSSEDPTHKRYVASLDRIDSSGGYTRDNVQFVCAQANYMKHTLPSDELVVWCKAIIENSDRKKVTSE